MGRLKNVYQAMDSCDRDLWHAMSKHTPQPHWLNVGGPRDFSDLQAANGEPWYLLQDLLRRDMSWLQLSGFEIRMVSYGLHDD